LAKAKIFVALLEGSALSSRFFENRGTQMLKSILAVILSYIIMAVLVTVVGIGAFLLLGVERVFQPDSYEVSTLWVAISAAVSIASAILGGYLCATISRSIKACMVLALIVLVIGIIFCFPKMREDPHVRAGVVPALQVMNLAQLPAWMYVLSPALAGFAILVGARAKRLTGTSGARTSLPLFVIGWALGGLILGIPMSYWFQPGALRMFVSLPDYLTNLGDALGGAGELNSGAEKVLNTLLFTTIVCAALGGTLGYLLYVQRSKAQVGE
jgi:hypothetical protein